MRNNFKQNCATIFKTDISGSFGRLFHSDKRQIWEAVKEVRHMGLRKWTRAMCDEHMKMVRDQHVRDDYVRNSHRKC